MLVTGLAGISACDQQAQTAEDFLRNVYAPYESGNAPNPTGSAAPAMFEPGFLALIQRDRQLANGEVGLIDHDPICACQDYDALTGITVSVERAEIDRAAAKVSFINASQPVTVGFQLVTVGGQWRIYDIEETGLPSLRNFLEAGIANLTNTQKPQ
jgi:hypothetical protein